MARRKSANSRGEQPTNFIDYLFEVSSEQVGKRTERLSLIAAPSTIAGITALAQLSDKSVNDFVNVVLESLVKKNAAVIEHYTAEKEKLRLRFDPRISLFDDGDHSGNSSNAE